MSDIDDEEVVVLEACAACKHQRRKMCEQNCPLSKYFPAEREADYENVHRLYGLQNTLKILDSVEEKDRVNTAETLIIEARMRRENPVYGSILVQKMLQAKIEEVQKELDGVNQQIQFFKRA